VVARAHGDVHNVLGTHEAHNGPSWWLRRHGRVVGSKRWKMWPAFFASVQFKAIVRFGLATVA